MRRVSKLPAPAILAENAATWLAEFCEDPNSGARRYRYRAPEIKAVLREETASKCVYCESKIGHNCPGDVEHKVPSSRCRDLHFEWSNLTIACTECNRRKNAYYDPILPFLDPYEDPVEDLLLHL